MYGYGNDVINIQLNLLNIIWMSDTTVMNIPCFSSCLRHWKLKESNKSTMDFGYRINTLFKPRNNEEQRIVMKCRRKWLSALRMIHITATNCSLRSFTSTFLQMKLFRGAAAARRWSYSPPTKRMRNLFFKGAASITSDGLQLRLWEESHHRDTGLSFKQSPRLRGCSEVWL